MIIQILQFLASIKTIVYLIVVSNKLVFWKITAMLLYLRVINQFKINVARYFRTEKIKTFHKSKSAIKLLKRMTRMIMSKYKRKYSLIRRLISTRILYFSVKVETKLFKKNKMISSMKSNQEI